MVYHPEGKLRYGGLCAGVSPNSLRNSWRNTPTMEPIPGEKAAELAGRFKQTLLDLQQELYIVINNYHNVPEESDLMEFLHKCMNVAPSKVALCSFYPIKAFRRILLVFPSSMN